MVLDGLGCDGMKLRIDRSIDQIEILRWGCMHGRHGLAIGPLGAGYENVKVWQRQERGRYIR